MPATPSAPARRRGRRAAILLLKACALAAVLAYTARHVDLEDSLVLPPIDSAAAGALRVATARDGTRAYVFDGAGGLEVRAHPAQRLVLSRERVDGGGYTARAGADVLYVPAALVDGHAIERVPGLRSLARQVRWPLVLLAVIAMAPNPLLLGLRWWVLLRGCGARIPYPSALRLHFLGLFFNAFMPGGTGGDIVKSFAVVRRTDRKAEAVSTVLVDRAIGLGALLAMAGAASALGGPSVGPFGHRIGVALLVLVGAAALFVSRRVRALVHWPALLLRLPGGAALARADEAIVGFARKPRVIALAIAVSGVALVVCLLATQVLGRALGIERATTANYFVYVPIAFVANAIPLSFGGFGFLEGTLLTLFSRAGVATGAQGFALGLLLRAVILAWSLPGAVFMFVGDTRALAAAARASAAVPAPASPPPQGSFPP